MDKYVPKEIEYSILPGHSAQRVVNYMRKIDVDKKVWDRSMMYSWIEFDGLMYVQQNGLTGIKELIEDGQKLMGARPLPGICFNHWRTAENRTTARYASLVTLYGPVQEEAFYQQYASNLEIGSINNYISAMKTLNEADWRMTNKLPNLGFCFVGCWVDNNDKKGTGGLGYFGAWKHDTILAVNKQLEQVRSYLQKCALETTSENGKEYLSFLDNRMRASIIYLKAIAKTTELQALFKDREVDTFTEKEKEDIVKTCDEALVLTNQYISTHTEQMPDRGCEGTLVSFYYTPPSVIKTIRQKFGNVSADKAPEISKSTDAPPAPIHF